MRFTITDAPLRRFHLAQRTSVLEEPGLHTLKGATESMLLYRVRSPREAAPDDREATMGGGFETLVGRDEEIGLLLRRWQQSQEGFGQVVLISGEAGIGKLAWSKACGSMGARKASRGLPFAARSTPAPGVADAPVRPR